MDEDSSSSSSEYEVEQFVRPDRIKRTINDDSADILGNFDDEKRKEIMEGRNASDKEDGNNSSDENSSDDEMETNGDDEVAEANSQVGTNGDTITKLPAPPANAKSKMLSKTELDDLLRGVSKSNRHVLYVTNIHAETSKEDLFRHFETAGIVKHVRLPKRKRCAFVEFADLEGYQRGFTLHNSELKGRQIKVQYSEAGKKKSANKKNIIKQKNRKLAQMRNELKTFTKSGKFYDKNLKKEKAVEALARKRWRKKPAAKKA